MSYLSRGIPFHVFTFVILVSSNIQAGEINKFACQSIDAEQPKTYLQVHIGNSLVKGTPEGGVFYKFVENEEGEHLFQQPNPEPQVGEEKIESEPQALPDSITDHTATEVEVVEYPVLNFNLIPESAAFSIRFALYLDPGNFVLATFDEITYYCDVGTVEQYFGTEASATLVIPEPVDEPETAFQQEQEEAAEEIAEEIAEGSDKKE